MNAYALFHLFNRVSYSMKWSIYNDKLLYKGFFKVSRIELTHELFAGGQSRPIVRELLDRGHAAAVLPYDPVRDEVVLIEQFRIGAINDPTGPWLLEVIAGIIEPGESAEDVIVREALEEAGCRITDIIPVQRFYSTPGGSTEEISVFAARTDTGGLGGVHGIEEEGEDIRVKIVSSDEAFELLDRGRIDSAMPIIALQWFRMNRERLRRKWQSTENYRCS
jgi:ADP-ribose pyrophosphatase